jgi:hypothetical protein
MVQVAVAKFDGPQQWARADVNMLIKFAADRRQNFTRQQQEVPHFDPPRPTWPSA